MKKDDIKTDLESERIESSDANIIVEKSADKKITTKKKVILGIVISFAVAIVAFLAIGLPLIIIRELKSTVSIITSEYNLNDFVSTKNIKKIDIVNSCCEKNAEGENIQISRQIILTQDQIGKCIVAIDNSKYQVSLGGALKIPPNPFVNIEYSDGKKVTITRKYCVNTKGRKINCRDINYLIVEFVDSLDWSNAPVFKGAV